MAPRILRSGWTNVAPPPLRLLMLLTLAVTMAPTAVRHSQAQRVDQITPNSPTYDPNIEYTLHSYQHPFPNLAHYLPDQSKVKQPESQQPTKRLVINNVNEYLQHNRPYISEMDEKRIGEMELQRKRGLEAANKATEEHEHKQSDEVSEQLRKEKQLAIADVNSAGQQDGVCTSWGDTHMIPYSGNAYDIWRTHTFVMTKLKSDAPDYFAFEIQARQKYWGGNDSPATVDKSVAMMCGSNIIEFDADESVSPNVVLAFLNGGAFTVGREDHKIEPVGSAAIKPTIHIKHSESGEMEKYQIDCRPAGLVNGKLKPGFALHIAFEVTRGVNLAFANINVLASYEYVRHMEGACGWSAPGPSGAIEMPNSPPCDESQNCITYDVKGRSLFLRDSAGDGVSESRNNPPLDAGALVPHREKCQQLTNQVIPNEVFVQLSAKRQSQISATEFNCAIDSVFGLAPTLSTIQTELCDEEQLDQQADAEDGNHQDDALLAQFNCPSS